MAFVSPRMSLSIWNAPSDPYDHEQLADNFLKLDQHDHSLGKGTAIGPGGIQDAAIQANHLFPGAVTSTAMATGLDPAPAFTTYKQLRHAYGTLASTTVAGTYALESGGPAAAVATASPGLAFYVDWADFAVAGRTTKVRMRCSVHNGTAQTANFVYTLVPVTFSGTTAALGTAVLTGTINAPGVGQNQAISNEVTAPAAGAYMIVVTTSATISTNTATPKANLQVRQT